MKSLKHLSALLTPVLFAGLSANAAFPIGDSVSVFVTGEMGSRFESNVLLINKDGNEKSDTVVYYTPGIVINAGKPGVTDFNSQVIYRYKVYSYSSLHALNVQDNDFNGTFSYKDSGFSVRGGFSYLEAQTNQDFNSDQSANYLEPGRVDRSVYNGNAYAEMSVSPKFKLGTGSTYSLQDYSTAGYTDFGSIAIPFDVYYSISPKTDVSLNYEYRPIYIGGRNDHGATDQTIGVGIRGNILSKLTGYVRAGLVSREYCGLYSNKDDDSGLSFSGNLSYEVSPLMNVGVRLTRDYSISPSTASTTMRTGTGIVASYSLTKTISLSGNISYYNTDYTDSTRTDNYLAGGISASYQPNEYFNFRVGYDYNMNDSNRNSSDYDDHILQVVATVRF
jgi:hypothetical protein